MNTLPPNPTKLKIILASASPRRRELLHMIAPDFDLAPARDVDESHPDGIPAEQVPVYLSQIKSDAYADIIGPDNVLLTADTVVICDNKILGKPHTPAEAHTMLTMLAGRAHTVVTGVTLRTAHKTTSFGETTTVHFANISDTEIQNYIDLYQPMDKAGAYGIQEWIGAIGIQGIDGDFYNVMGLPLHRLYSELKKL